MRPACVYKRQQNSTRRHFPPPSEKKAMTGAVLFFAVAVAAIFASPVPLRNARQAELSVSASDLGCTENENKLGVHTSQLEEVCDSYLLGKVTTSCSIICIFIRSCCSKPAPKLQCLRGGLRSQRCVPHKAWGSQRVNGILRHVYAGDGRRLDSDSTTCRRQCRIRGQELAGL